MAKSLSTIKLQGTIGNLTHVQSRTYGYHVRAKRGTHKTAEVNDALKQESKRLLSANIPAKIFKDAIDPFRGCLKGGQLWQRLVSVFRKLTNDHGSFDFGKLGRFEIHADYPFDRFLDVKPTIKPEMEKCLLHVDIKYDRHPNFSKVKFIDGYQLTVIGIFPDMDKKSATTVAIASDVMGLEGIVAPLRVQLAMPPEAKNYFVCIKIEGYTKGVASDARTACGMCVIGAG